MTQRSPFDIVKHQHITEKSIMLQSLHNSKEKRPKSLARCDSPKYVFIVDRNANKQEIAKAIEEIYSDKKVKVMAVNTINVKPKPRRVRGKPGFTAGFKKAIVTLEKGDKIEDT